MTSWDAHTLHQPEEVYKNYTPGHSAEMFYRIRVPGGWIYTHSIQLFGGWWPKRAHVMDTFVPDQTAETRPP